MKNIPLMVAKPVLKKFRKEIQKLNKAQTSGGGSFKNLNKAQSRLDSAKEYTQGLLKIAKKKLKSMKHKSFRSLKSVYMKVLLVVFGQIFILTMQILALSLLILLPEVKST